MTINVHEAQIHTATVEIKTLTVSGRQVTQALFRQLLEEPLYEPTAMTAWGTPWGTVNYHPDKCGDQSADHLHVVWQKGAELRRSMIRRPFWCPVAKEGSAWLDAALARGWQPEIPVFRRDWQREWWATELEIPFGDWEPSIRTSDEAKLVLRRAADFGWDNYLVDAAVDALKEKSGLGDGAVLQRKIILDLERQRRSWQWMDGRWTELCSLPQLFIAV